jgi:hypothetical protein
VIRVQVQGRSDWSIPRTELPSCRAGGETYFVVLHTSGGPDSVPMLNLRIPLAEFDSIDEANAVAKTIREQIDLGKPISYMS